jgi:tetratricopeptide (TPR) repeat protein
MDQFLMMQNFLLLRKLQVDFAKQDRDQNGQLDREEWKAFLTLAFGPEQAALESEILFTQCDEDGSGQLSLQEVYNWLQNRMQNAATRRERQNAPPRPPIEKVPTAPPPLPRSVQYKELGNEAFSTGDYITAINAYSNAIENDSEYFLAYSNRSNAFFQVEQYQASLSDAVRCIEINPNWSKAYFRQGLALEALGRQEEAIEALYKAVSLRHHDETFALELARVMALCPGYTPGPKEEKAEGGGQGRGTRVSLDKPAVALSAIVPLPKVSPAQQADQLKQRQLCTLKVAAHKRAWKAQEAGNTATACVYMAEGNELEAQLDALLVMAAKTSKARAPDEQEALQAGLNALVAAKVAARAKALKAQEAGEAKELGIHTAEANRLEAEFEGMLAEAGVHAVAKLRRMIAEKPTAKLERLIAEKVAARRLERAAVEHHDASAYKVHEERVAHIEEKLEKLMQQATADAAKNGVRSQYDKKKQEKKLEAIRAAKLAVSEATSDGAKGEAWAEVDRLELEAVHDVEALSLPAEEADGEHHGELKRLYTLNAAHDKQAMDRHDLHKAEQQAQLDAMLAARKTKREAATR